MYEKYALLKAQIKSLTGEMDELNVEIIKDMMDRGAGSEQHAVGKFTVSKRKTWTYSDSVTTMAEKLKATKAKEESTGDATFTESESLLFTPINL